MQAATYIGNSTMEVTTRDQCAPRAGEVQIEVAYVGICGTDLHVLHGNMDQRVQLPATIGHEMSGVVAAVGDDVTDWAAGDRVTVMPLSWDGTCPACRAGNQHICQNLDFIGIDTPGALQGYWNVPADVLVRLPESVDLRTAALVEPVAVAVHDVSRAGLATGEKAVVVGGGPIGLLIAVVARSVGAEVLVVEPDAASTDDRGIARVHSRHPGRRHLSGRGVDQRSGSRRRFRGLGRRSCRPGATSLARVRGRVVVVAIHPQPRPLDLHRVFWRELTILGARVYERADFERAAELLAEGAIPTDVLITAVVPLTQMAHAFERLSKGQEMKVLIDVQAGAR